ncbi:MAG: helix-turn-helix domain-containing protein [Pseudonocardiaceae bacterium]
MPARSTGGDALSRTLQQLRDDAGLRQVDTAERTGFSQGLIARFETGRQVPRPDQVEKLCDAYGAPVGARRRAVEMARDARAGTERVVMHRDLAPAQKRINRIAATATLERTFSPSGVPGLLQTAEYCRVLFHSEPQLAPQAAEDGVAARLEGQSILDSDRQFGFLIPEGSLGWSLLPPTPMVDQIDHLAILTGRSHIRLGVIPWGSPTPVLPLNSFTMFDDRLVIVGTTTRVAYLTVRTDLDAYNRLYDRIAAFAVYGEEAREILARVANRYRELDI